MVNVDEIAELSTAEKRALLARLLRERGGRAETPAPASSPPAQCVHHLVEAQARRVPAAQAVVALDGRLTYAELDARADRVARHLRAAGVGPDSAVGICLSRTLDLVPALLGVLKAGGAYVPLDPAYPPERLAYMAKDAGLVVMVTNAAGRSAVAGCDAPELRLEDVWNNPEGESTKLLADIGVGPDNLSYVIYTSGSTGQPKGAQLPHRALVNLLESLGRILGLTERDVVAATSPTSFDLATLEIFLPLSLGACVHIFQREALFSGNQLIRDLERLGITVLQATPTTWRLFLDAGWKGSPGITMLSGGEPLPRDLADELRAHGGTLWNLYGPTETTIYSTGGKVEPGTGLVPIGGPVAQTQLYILDAALQPVPMGMPGELYIGGEGLARGYCNRPALTAEKFIADPFSGQPGARIYRSGDLARFRPDGQLECLGRIDNQVKIRGYRIEPGEIEEALRKHPEVNEAVVLAREDTPGDRRLVAYIVTPSAVPVAELWAWLKERLPEYMVPGSFVTLDALPLTPSGKVDRQALPAPEQAGLVPVAEYVPPRGLVEETLAWIWSTVLGAERVGAEDNFFLLGGHSLKATQLLAQVRDSFGVELPLRSLFEAPTVAGLARRLEEAMKAAPRIDELPKNDIAEISSADLDRPSDEGLTRGRSSSEPEMMMSTVTDFDHFAGMTTAEKRAMLARLIQERGERSVTPPSAPRCAHHLFEAQARRVPASVAIVASEGQLTYAQLDERANRIAHRLRELGVGPDVLVGLCVERSLDLVAAFLGVLKAGGAYVPLDPNYPAERLSYMAQDAGLGVLLTSVSTRGVVTESGAAELCLDEVGEGPSESVSVSVGGENLAYVIYTSGSTGRPKGVEIPHGALVNFLESMSREPGLTERDVLLAVTTLSFDIAALELLLPLVCGARIVLVDRGVSSDGSELSRVLGESGATVMQATPATWRLLLGAGWSGDAGLKILCGGEAMARDLAEELLSRSGSLWNMYGPTETTVWSSLSRVESGPGAVPIGRPVAQTQLYVLDAALQPVPVGMPGELYIGGAGLARGYHDRPGLTAERFIPDPFSSRPEARLYRTGDLARYRPDGQLECLGRIDNQVKIRGYRIEPGEIEQALRKHPEVREAVVLAREDTPGDRRLVAYVTETVTLPEAPPTENGQHLPAHSANGHASSQNGEAKPARDPARLIAQLRDQLKSRLPEYMVPSAFVLMDELPLTPNGKLDRAALPAPAQGDRSGLSRPFQVPRNAADEEVARVWAEVLDIPAAQIGIHDDFFELGGHSLLATQVVSRLRERLGLELPLRYLFDAPTVAGLVERIEAARDGDLIRSAPPIVPMPREGAVPLSYAQQALWFLEQLTPGEPTFNVTSAVRITGVLDVDVLRRSFHEMIGRHESLRTTFHLVDGRPIQTIAPSVPLPMNLVDLRGLPEESRQAEAQRLAAKEAGTPFDLTQGPLVRAQVLALGDQEHVLLLTMHHIITDGWSFWVAARELVALYEAFLLDRPSPLSDPVVQYADYVLWQRNWLQGEALDELLGYWTTQLHGAAPLELPTDRPRGPSRTARGALQNFALSPRLSQALEALARREGVTPFMLLLAAFKTLLHRYSGQDDITVGSPIASRNRAELERLVGYFVNMLALRTDLSGNPTFRTLLARVRAMTLRAYEHQDLPLEILVQKLHPQRDPSRTPLFQVMFVLQNNRLPDVSGQNLAVTPLGNSEGTGTAKFDLTMALEETDQGIVGSLEYQTDLFNASTIERMIRHFEILLEGVVAAPDTPLNELSILSEVERRQLLLEWSGSSTQVPPVPVVVHELFEAHARQTPDAPALIVGERTWSYGELNLQADCLARRLRGRGVALETKVGLCLRDPADRLVGLLATLKAGGAYVPLDPDLPVQRLAFLAQDSALGVLLTEGEIGNDWPGLAASIVRMDDGQERTVEKNGTHVEACPSPDNLAYVLYTSGSTGTPKGVMVTHASLASVYQAWEESYHLKDEVRRHLQVASFTFDVYTGEWVRALCSGGTLIACPKDVLLEPEALYEMMRRERVDAVELVPAVVENLINYLEESGKTLDFPRLIVVGSDLLNAGVYERLRRLVGPQTRVLNSYGLTEAAIDSTYFEGISADQPVGGTVPIGRPLPNTQVYVLDRQRHLVPVGVPGELYVGGSGLARGYHGRPELTSEKFIPSPFDETPGARLYKTGDLAQWRGDGQLEILGRIDGQVKIRGFRIELGEIESVLRKNPKLREAVVSAREDAPGNKRLVAYVVVRPDVECGTPELRRWVQAALPEYMVPSAFVQLSTLPLLVNGKIDRAALPAPDARQVDLGNAYEAPRTPREEALALIWAEVLGLERVGINDNFFDLGGHSLQMVQLVSRVTSALGRRLSVKTVFQSPTVATMAEALEADPSDNASERTDIADVLAKATATGEASSHVAVTDRPLLELFAAKEIAPVDAVSVGYFPSSLLGYEGLSAEMIRHDLCGDKPVVAGVRETSWGRLGVIMIPRFDYELYEDPSDLLAVLGEALRLARSIGARTASLTGLLPSATDYGRKLAERFSDPGLPAITTGHATTTAAVVLAIRHALEEGGRDLSREKVGFVGLGSVGQATLRLMLSCLPHPEELILCDVLSKQDEMLELRREVVERLGYQGRVTLLESRREVPQELYSATLIVGATNVPDILEMDAVAPGTILVDDSAPHCFRTDHALKRLKEKGDILVTEGGVLAAPEVLPVLAHLPRMIEGGLRDAFLAALVQTGPEQITGCVFSALLSSRFSELPPTLGLIDLETSRRHYETLDRLGFSSARLHLDETPLSDELVGDFRARFGMREKQQSKGRRPNGEGRASSKPSAGSPLVPIQTSGTRPPLFFVHPIGGNVLCYFELARRLGTDQPFFGLQAPGLEGECIPVSNMEAMASPYIEAIRAVQPSGPYLLGGWSLGGVVAFEMARQLREAGQEVSLLIAIDSEAPNRNGIPARIDDLEMLSEFLENLTRDLGSERGVPLKRFRGLSLEQAWPVALQELRRNPSFPREIGDERIRALWNVYRANYVAFLTYIPRPSPDRLLLIRAAEACLDPTLGWGGLALGGVNAASVKGDHFTVLRGEGARMAAEQIRAALRAVNGAGEAELS